jgi:DedD protein
MLDARVKERLTGAIILVAVLVLLVPELLTGPSRSANRTTQAPTNVDGAQMRSYTINLSEDPDAPLHAGAPAVTETPSSASAAAELQGAGSAGGSASVEAPSMSASDERASPGERPATAAATAPGASAAREARSAADEISAASGNTAPRSRVDGADAAAGATEGRKTASRADASSKAGVSADAPGVASVSPAPPANAGASEGRKSASRAEPSPAARTGSTESPPGTGWAWQVGSFASRENAEKLTRQLKGKGFAATVSETSGRGGKRLWRVRVGPEADRAAAVALGARIRSAGQPGGAPVPYP